MPSQHLPKGGDCMTALLLDLLVREEGRVQGLDPQLLKVTQGFQKFDTEQGLNSAFNVMGTPLSLHCHFHEKKSGTM